MRNFKGIRNFFFLLALCQMIGIFCFSARNADLSTEDSHRVGRLVGSLLIPGFESWTEEKQEAFAGTIDYPIRKAAHASEYCVLAMLLAAFFLAEQACRIREGYERGDTPGQNHRGMLRRAFLCTTLYAVSDEFHQIFVPGRSCQVKDIVIDSAGALTGLVLIWLLMNLHARLRHR